MTSSMGRPSDAAKHDRGRSGGQRSARSVRADSAQLTLSEAMRARDASRQRPKDEQLARELEPPPDDDHDAGEGGSAPVSS